FTLAWILALLLLACIQRLFVFIPSAALKLPTSSNRSNLPLSSCKPKRVVALVAGQRFCDGIPAEAVVASCGSCFEGLRSLPSLPAPAAFRSPLVGLFPDLSVSAAPPEQSRSTSVPFHVSSFCISFGASVWVAVEFSLLFCV